MTRAWAAAALGLALLGVAIRVQNAFHYPVGMGFDAFGNWAYALALAETGRLPAPHESWSAAHPPLFYAVAALTARVASLDMAATFVATRLLTSLAGLVAIGIAVDLVRRVAPGEPRRALIAGGLLLFLPVHVYMSAMFGEELLVTMLLSLVVATLAREGAEAPRATTLARDAGIGIAAGLALLTKLTGLLGLLVAVATVSLDGIRRGDFRRGALRAATIGLIGIVVGGWFYARNLVRYGYVYPHGLEIHAIMETMPPGERRLADYLRVPLATWTAPDLASPPLLHSVWGSTYVSLWADGHGHFLPLSDPWAGRASRLILLLAVLPTAAGLIGLARGARRAWRRPRGPDLPLLLLVAATVAGYVAFTWRNPSFVVLKGSFLLGLSVPYAFYASEVLSEWTDRARGAARAGLVSAALLALLVTVTVTFSFGVVFLKQEEPGIPWAPTLRPAHPVSQ